MILRFYPIIDGCTLEISRYSLEVSSFHWGLKTVKRVFLFSLRIIILSLQEGSLSRIVSFR